MISTRPPAPGPVATAFGYTFASAVGLIALGVVPAALLAILQRPARSSTAHPDPLESPA